MADAVDEMQQFLLANVYLSGENLRKSREGQRIISELFAAYLADSSLLPERYLRRIDSGGEASLHRVVCDYIAGMTDRYCKQAHERICGGA